MGNYTCTLDTQDFHKLHTLPVYEYSTKDYLFCLKRILS